MASNRTTVWPGRPHPLGATWDGSGVNFALFSAHATKVELCLFDREGRREIEGLHERLLGNLRLAQSVFMMKDLGAARTLLVQKDEMRALEQEAIANHLQRLREGRLESIETSSLHLDIARDLKRIAAHIASVAYPILEQNGALRPTRLRAMDSASPR